MSVAGTDPRVGLRRLERPWSLLLAAFAALFLWGLVSTAWISDDGFIGIRTIENVVAGHGMRWNVADRTHTFTAALWQLSMTAVRAITGESYYSILIWSMLLAATGVGIALISVGRLAAGAIVAASAMASSRSFVEYSTGGLGSPLSYVFAGWFLAIWFRDPNDEERARHLRSLSVIGGLFVLTRYDQALLVLPALVVACRGVAFRRVMSAVFLGAAPLATWMIFSWIYYGSPFPLTAFAKAFCPQIPQTSLFVEAWNYLVNLVAWDPVTALTIFTMLALSFRGKIRGAIPIAIGLLLYGGYLFRIGGDFMSGRFFSVPLFLAAAVLTRLPIRPGAAAVWALALIPLALMPLVVFERVPPWASTPGHGQHAASPPPRISDEREVYYPRFGLLSPTRKLQRPNAFSLDHASSGTLIKPAILVEGAVGYAGFIGGPLLHIVDYWLCDPLLARLPKSEDATWKIGHYARRVPEGWFETLATGQNHIRHDGLRPLIDDLLPVLRGEDLFATARLAAIWRLSTGAHTGGVARFVAEEYDDPPLVRARDDAFANLAANGTPWWERSMQVVYLGGVEYRPEEAIHTLKLEAALDAADQYLFSFFLGPDAVGVQAVVSAPQPFQGSSRIEFDTPDAARDHGFDRVVIRAGDSFDRVHAIGGLRPVSE